MIAGILITVREGLEAFLVVGILLGILNKMGQRDKSKYIWAGSAAAIAASIGLAYIIQLLSIEFEGTASLVFEGIVASLAIGVLTYMVTWMHKQSRNLKHELQKKIAVAVSNRQVWALVGLAFITILREGIETALFLSAVAQANAGTGLMVGALIGLAAAGIISLLITRAAVRFNLQMFFRITGSFIVVIAGGLLAHFSGVIQQLGFNVLTQTAWNTGALIPDGSLAGKLLHAFTGYLATPSLLQVMVYIAYIGGMITFLWKGAGSPSLARKQKMRELIND